MVKKKKKGKLHNYIFLPQEYNQLTGIMMKAGIKQAF